jgi:hypothetical protein
MDRAGKNRLCALFTAAYPQFNEKALCPGVPELDCRLIISGREIGHDAADLNAVASKIDERPAKRGAQLSTNDMLELVDHVVRPNRVPSALRGRRLLTQQFRGKCP